MKEKTHAVTALIWPILVGWAINNMNDGWLVLYYRTTLRAYAGPSATEDNALHK